MNGTFRRLSATTSITLGLAALSTTAMAQPYEALSGVMVPGCNANVEAADAGTLGAEAFDKKGRITAEIVRAAIDRDEACISNKGKLKLRGASAALLGMAEGVDPDSDGAAMAAEETAQAETPAPAETAQAEAAAEPPGDAAAPTSAEELASELLNRAQGSDGSAEAEVEAEVEAEAEAEVEAEAEAPAANAAANAEADTEPAADMAEAPAEPTAEATAEAPAADMAETTAEAQPEAEMAAAEPASEMPAAAAATDANGREQEPAQVEETMVTEENSRSSSEEFAKPEQNAAATSGTSDKGLSNLEKFALGAAGIVALEAIIGNNREVVSNSGDRVVLRNQDGDLEVLRDDDTLLRRPGSEVRTETFSDGSTRTTVTRADGSRIVTIADAAGRVIKRTRVTPDDREVVLIDDTGQEVRPVDVSRLPPPKPERRFVESNDRAALEAALRANTRTDLNRSFTLRQVRQYREVRDLMPEINIDAINFRTGSAAIEPEEAEELLDLGQAMSMFIRDNPDELFLVEGHTDAVGDAVYNLSLSDRRAESVALALTEYFDVPPENMIIQGYGESELLVPTGDAERANRRAVVRRVTPLLR